MRQRCWQAWLRVWLCAAALSVAAHSSHAESSPAAVPSARLIVDRATVEPSALPGFLRVRLLVSAVALEGGLLDLDNGKQVKLFAGASAQTWPVAIGRFGRTPLPLSVMVLVQNSMEFGEVTPTVVAGLEKQLAQALAPNVQVSLVTYSDVVSPSRPTTAKTFATQLTALTGTDVADAPALAEAVDRALLQLRRQKELTRRKVLLIIGDGRDRDNDREAIAELGKRAGRDGVRIHALGFAATGVRRPLLALGELAKQSLGTFRWVRTAGTESWSPAFAQLIAELNDQFVFTYFVPTDAVAGKKLHLEAAGLRSNEVKLPDAACNDAPCSGACLAGRCVVLARGVGRAWGKLGAILAGSLLLLVAVLVVVARRRPKPTASPQPASSGLAPAGPASNPAGPDGGVAASGGMKTMALPALDLARQPAHGMAPPAYAPVAAPPPGGAATGAVAMAPTTATASAHGATATKPSTMAPAIAAPMAAAGQVSRPAVSAAPTHAPAAALYVLSGSRQGQRVALGPSCLIGRAAGCHLVLDDYDAAPVHAEVVFDAWGNAAIYDRSNQGVVVGGQRVKSAGLTHGAIVRIGTTDLRYLAE